MNKIIIFLFITLLLMGCESNPRFEIPSVSTSMAVEHIGKNKAELFYNIRIYYRGLDEIEVSTIEPIFHKKLNVLTKNFRHGIHRKIHSEESINLIEIVAIDHSNVAELEEDVDNIQMQDYIIGAKIELKNGKVLFIKRKTD
jgi:hypothetical protein